MLESFKNCMTDVHATPDAQEGNKIQGNPFRTITSIKFIEGTEAEEDEDIKN